MGTVPRAAAALTVPLLAASLITPCHGAYAAERVGPAAVRDPIGGPRLGGRGVVINAGPGVPKAPKVTAGAYVIADGDTGEVLGAKNPHGHFLPASALKTLTAVSLIPKLDAGSLIRPTQKTCDVEGTKVGMTPKMEYKVSDLFHALMMVSGNDAALALAQAGGGLDKTLATMNAEARRLQAADTLAGSPNGLDVDLGLSVKTQHTSAYDLALIMRQGLKLEDFRRYVGTVHYQWPAPPTKKQRKKGKKTGGYPIYSHDRLLPGEPRAYRGMIGGKNGYTNAAGQTFVGAARRDGHTIIIALMKGVNIWGDAKTLLDWGFAAYGKAKPVGKLVDPVDTAKPKTTPHADNLPLATPLTGDDSAQGWGNLAAVVGGTGLMVAAVVILFYRRRRRDTATSTGPDPTDPS